MVGMRVRIFARLLCVLVLPFWLSSCALMKELEMERMAKNEFRERQALIEDYRESRNPKLLSETYKLNPVVAAVTMAPSMIPEMVENGVDPNYVVPASTGSIFYTKPTTALMVALRLSNGFESRYEISSALLGAGADPNVQFSLCNVTSYTFSGNRDNAVSLLTLLLRHGANPNVMCGDKPIAKHMEEQGGDALGEFIRDTQKSGVEVAHERWLNRDARLAAEAAQREREYKRQAQLRKERRAVIRQAFNQDPDLRKALSLLKRSAAPCQTLQNMARELDNFSCDLWLGELYTSRACQRRQKQILSLNRQQSRQACGPYKKSRRQLAKLFGEHAQLADDVIGKALSGQRGVSEIEQAYRAELNTLTRIRNRETRGEKAEDERRYQQGVAHLAQYVQQSFGEKSAADKIIEQSVANTQQALFAIDRAHKAEKAKVDMAEINANMAAINARLKAASAAPTRAPAPAAAAPQSPAKSPGAVAKHECIAQSESKGPMPNVPQHYCHYVFADNTDNVSMKLDDYSSEFNAESGSVKHAESVLHSGLLKKATERCQAAGYSRVHHSQNFEFHKVAMGPSDCKENTRMGSTFYLCSGSGSFICARRQ